MHKGFHVHIDACEMTDRFSAELLKMGFHKAAFIPVHERSYAPDFHYTQKPKEKAEYESVFQKLRLFWDTHREARGYIEGECIKFDEPIDWSPLDQEVRVPFRVKQ